MTTEKTYTIYGVTDPRDGIIRYIGQTINPRSRFKQHRAGAGDQPVGRWERKLRQQGIVPLIVILEQELLVDDVNIAEARWIAEAREKGWPLLNLVAGATSEPHGCPLPSERRAKIAESMRLRWQDPAFRAEKEAKIKAAMAKPEWAEKHRIGCQDHEKPTEETKAKVAESVRTLWEDPEYRASQEVAVRIGLEKTRANAEAEAKRKATMGKPEVRAKIAEKSRQMWQNPESRAKLLAERRARGAFTEEHKRKIAEGLARAKAEGRRPKRELTDEQRHKISDGNRRSFAEGRRNRVYSDAHRQAISEGNKRAWAEGRRRKLKAPGIIDE